MMRFISFYNLLFFCLSQTADSNRRLGYSEYKYPSNDTGLRSFFFSMPVDITLPGTRISCYCHSEAHIYLNSLLSVFQC